MSAKVRFILLSKEKEDPGGSQYHQKRKQIIESEATMSHSETIND